MSREVTQSDLDCIGRQLQRKPRDVHAIAYRCPCGNPAVVETPPRLADGTPLTGNKSPYPFGFSFIKLLANLDTSKEIIRLEYGRKVAEGFEGTTSVEGLKTIIETKEKKVYLLNKYSHTFKFDEKGVVSLDIKYFNFHDTAINSSNNVAVPSTTPENLNLLNINNYISQETSNFKFNHINYTIDRFVIDKPDNNGSTYLIFDNKRTTI